LGVIFGVTLRLLGWLSGFMVFNATFNNISAISWWSVLLVEPVQVELPMGATQVAAGGHHTVVLLSNGQVYTFGNHKVKGVYI
jgi:hypothetical protein